MDRVKGAIFNSLGERVINARVLDLFAGSGALGIEALSRGAESAMFVEENRAAAQTIEQNFLRTKVRGPIRKQEVFAFLDSADRGRALRYYPGGSAVRENEKRRGVHAHACWRTNDWPHLLEPAGIFVLEKRPEEKIVSSGFVGRPSAQKATAQRKCSSLLRRRGARDSRMIRLIYNLLFPLGLLFFLPGYLLKMRRRGNYRRNFGQRFGFTARRCARALRGAPSTWIHAVSVGEVAIALKFARRLRALDPKLSLLS